MAASGLEGGGAVKTVGALLAALLLILATVALMAIGPSVVTGPWNPLSALLLAGVCLSWLAGFVAYSITRGLE